MCAHVGCSLLGIQLAWPDSEDEGEGPSTLLLHTVTWRLTMTITKLTLHGARMLRVIAM